jgi:hypothetical protein
LRLETAVAPAEVIRLSEYLLERDVHVSVYRAFPNYLVGLGLCITFLGLAVVIGNASAVIGNASAVIAPVAGDSNLALRDLLVAASSKFWSSLAAVFCSICYGIWFRIRSQKMELDIGNLARDLGQCVKVISNEEINYESIQRLRRCEGYQSITAHGIGLLKSGLDFTQSSSAEQHRILLDKLEAVTEGLALKLGQLGHDLGKDIGSMGSQLAGSLTQVNEEAFAKIVTEMINSLHNATDVHLKCIAERLEAVSLVLQKVPAEFDGLVGRVQESTTSIATAFASAVKPIEISLAAASNSATDVAEKFATLPDSLEPARGAAKDLASAATSISGMVDRIHSQNMTVVKRWEELSDLILSIDTHLARAVESVGDIFPLYAENLQNFSNKWEGAMVSALGGLSANIRDLSSSHEELRTQRTVWHDSADAVGRSVDLMNEHVTHFTEALAAHGEAQKLAIENAAIMSRALPLDVDDSISRADKTSDVEIISTATTE